MSQTQFNQLGFDPIKLDQEKMIMVSLLDGFHLEQLGVPPPLSFLLPIVHPLGRTFHLSPVFHCLKIQDGCLTSENGDLHWQVKPSLKAQIWLYLENHWTRPLLLFIWCSRSVRRLFQTGVLLIIRSRPKLSLGSAHMKYGVWPRPKGSFEWKSEWYIWTVLPQTARVEIKCESYHSWMCHLTIKK